MKMKKLKFHIPRRKIPVRNSVDQAFLIQTSHLVHNLNLITALEKIKHQRLVISAEKSSKIEFIHQTITCQYDNGTIVPNVCLKKKSRSFTNTFPPLINFFLRGYVGIAFGDFKRNRLLSTHKQTTNASLITKVTH